MMTIEILNYNRRGNRNEQELLPYVTTEAGTFNQAMMELGALICTEKSIMLILSSSRKL